MNYLKKDILKLHMDFKNGLIIHHIDIDGRGIEILGKYYMPNRFNYQKCEADETDDVLIKTLKSGKYDLIIIGDLNFHKKETLNAILKFIREGNQFYVIDHHEPSKKYENYPWAYVSISMNGYLNSGTELFYHFLNQQIEYQSAPKELVELIRLYDTWDWKKNKKYLANDLNQLFCYDKEAFVKNTINKLNNNLKIFSDEDLKILSIIKKLNDGIISRAVEKTMYFEFNGDKVALAFSPKLKDNIADVILSTHKEVDFVLILENLDKMSFRSRDNFDVRTKYAKPLGGDGHKVSCSCPINEKLRKYIFEHILKKDL